MAQVVGSRRKRWLETMLVYVVLGILALAFVFPLIWVLGLSLKTRLQIFATPPLYLWWPTLENYADVLTRSDFAQAFINTLIVSASAVLLSLCVGVPAAYAFARFPFTGRTFLFFALLVMRMHPLCCRDQQRGRNQLPASTFHVRRTYSGRPSSSIRFSDATAMATSVVCRPSVRERSASPITRL